MAKRGKIQQLLNRYSDAVTRRDWGAFAIIYAEDAVWEGTGEMGGAVVIAGDDVFPFIAAQLDAAAGNRFQPEGALGWRAVPAPAVAAIGTPQHARRAVAIF